MLPLLVAATGLTVDDRPHWPTLPTLYVQGRVHADPACADITGTAPTVDPHDQARARTANTCPRCTTPVVDSLLAHPSAPELSDTALVLSFALDADLWARNAFQIGNRPAALADQLADPTRAPEVVAHFTAHPETSNEILEALTLGTVAHAQATALLHPLASQANLSAPAALAPVPESLAVPWRARVAAIGTRLQASTATLRTVLDDTLLTQIAHAKLGEPAHGGRDGWCFIAPGNTVERTRLVAHLRMLWPDRVHLSGDRVAAWIPTAYARAWLPGYGAVAVAAPGSGPQPADDGPAADQGVDMIATALRLWQPRHSANETALDATGAFAAAAGILTH